MFKMGKSTKQQYSKNSLFFGSFSKYWPKICLTSTSVLMRPLLITILIGFIGVSIWVFSYLYPEYRSNIQYYSGIADYYSMEPILWVSRLGIAFNCDIKPDPYFLVVNNENNNVSNINNIKEKLLNWYHPKYIQNGDLVYVPENCLLLFFKQILPFYDEYFQLIYHGKYHVRFSLITHIPDRMLLPINDEKLLYLISKYIILWFDTMHQNSIYGPYFINLNLNNKYSNIISNLINKWDSIPLGIQVKEKIRGQLAKGSNNYLPWNNVNRQTMYQQSIELANFRSKLILENKTLENRELKIFCDFFTSFEHNSNRKKNDFLAKIFTDTKNIINNKYPRPYRYAALHEVEHYNPPLLLSKHLKSNNISSNIYNNNNTEKLEYRYYSKRWSERILLINWLNDKNNELKKNNLVVELESGKTKNFLDLLEARSNYVFILSPRGDKIDCWRIWESLIAGHIVITHYQNNNYSKIKNIFDGLPVILIKDWQTELTINNLQIWYEKYKDWSSLTNATVKYRLTNRHWINKMKLMTLEEINKNK